MVNCMLPVPVLENHQICLSMRQRKINVPALSEGIYNCEEKPDICENFIQCFLCLQEI
ncbi:uncharacterized protein LOC143204121 [Rhynchophorus ferrugineus]|uniref:uncharacterized protein LOC143204121 n=1 Tax=Rhynchophorus ferrugineus TaxID=354439 RepID=UPI003FCE27A8